jgi:Bacterial Ig-like domain (group 2)
MKEWPWEKKERERREQFKQEQAREHEEERRLKHLEHEVEEIEELEEEELKELRRAQSATLVILNEKGERLMPATLVVGQTAEAKYQEWSLPAGGGVALLPAGVPAFATSDGSIATVDAASGHITAVAAGTVTITGSDAVNGLNASDTVTNTGIQAQSATLVITPNSDAPSGAPTPGSSPTPAFTTPTTAFTSSTPPDPSTNPPSFK